MAQLLSRNNTSADFAIESCEQTMGEPTLSIRVVVRHSDGLHARPAQALCERAMQFNSEIMVLNDQVTADGKSIWQLLSLCAEENTELTIRATGEDAQEALDSLAALVEDNFGFSNENKAR